MEMIKEHPLLFKAEMVRATLDGRKTHTRRIVAPSNSLIDGFAGGVFGLSKKEIFAKAEFLGDAFVDPGPSPAGNPGPYLKCPIAAHSTVHRLYPKYQVGDRLWVRENWRTGRGLDDYPPRMSGSKSPFQFQCDLTSIRGEGITEYSPWGKWRPSIHMPRWASRINLKITDIRVERVQEISEKDAMAEGLLRVHNMERTDRYPGWRTASITPILEVFQKLWDSINAKRGYPWADNNWVWVLEFEVIDPAASPEGE